jgi:hypothetical protein
MKNFIQLATIIAALCVSSTVFSQNLISSTYKGVRTKTQLISQFGIPFIQYGVKYYKVTYTSPDVEGNLDTLSGLLVMPNDPARTFPRLVYQHGTSDCKTCVPSRYGSTGGGEGEVGLLLGGMGYVSLLPDYAGMGDGRGFHPYVHAATEASAAADMVRASAAWLTQNGFSANDQLFITGYSQGGHASAALHRLVETELAGEMTVTAAAHNSGPYSISGVMRGLIQSTGVYYYPGYIPNTVLSYQTAYGNLYNNLSDVFKPEYVAKIEQYYNGTISLSALNQSLISTLTSQTGASVPSRIIQDSILEAIANQPNHPFNMAMRDNDVYDWAPQAPTRIFYCTADDQVPFMNSIVARDTMIANGAVDLVATDVNSTANHGTCYNPAMTQTILFFAGFQQITVDSKEPEALTEVNVAPNPAQDILTVSALPEQSIVTLYDWNGREVMRRYNTGSTVMQLEVKALPVGIYALRFASPNGKSGQRQVVISR